MENFSLNFNRDRRHLVINKIWTVCPVGHSGGLAYNIMYTFKTLLYGIIALHRI